MGSVCTLRLDDIDLAEYKSFVPDIMRALFQESDRVETPGAEGGPAIVEYQATRQSILKRLDLMGCTAALAKRRFREWREETIHTEESWLSASAGTLRRCVGNTLWSAVAIMELGLRQHRT